MVITILYVGMEQTDFEFHFIKFIQIQGFVIKTDRRARWTIRLGIEIVKIREDCGFPFNVDCLFSKRGLYEHGCYDDDL